jgi:hypothetical protein
MSHNIYTYNKFFVKRKLNINKNELQKLLMKTMRQESLRSGVIVTFLSLHSFQHNHELLASCY